MHVIMNAIIVNACIKHAVTSLNFHLLNQSQVFEFVYLIRPVHIILHHGHHVTYVVTMIIYVVVN